MLNYNNYNVHPSIMVYNRNRKNGNQWCHSLVTYSLKFETESRLIDDHFNLSFY